MNRSSLKEEEEVAETERTATFYLWQPCYFLEEALRALRAFLRCLGVETGTRKGSMKKEDEKSPLLKHASDADLDHNITPKNSASNSQKSHQEAADPPSTTSQIINASAMERRGPRKPPLSQGSGSQHN